MLRWAVMARGFLYPDRAAPAAMRKVIFETVSGPCSIARVQLALTFGRRCSGLLGRAPPGPGYAMYLAPCSAVHTWGMRFALDLIFVARDGRLVRVVPGVRPWRMVRGGRRAWGVLELQAGWFPWARLTPAARMTLV